MSIDVNAIEQTVEVTAVGDEVNVNIIDQPVLVSVTDQIIEVEASGAAGPQGPVGAGVAAGGVTGQVLIKASNTNYDTTWTNAGAGTVYSVNASGSTGINVTGGPITGAGTLTITNTAPDQIVGLTGAGTAVITGTYPNFTITANDQFSGTVTSVNLTAGTGISVSGGPITASGSINVVNTSPDQVVSLTGGGTTTITGTYPNFTISSADSTVGTVTSVNMTVPTGLTISGNPITSAGTLALALASGYSIPTTSSQATWDTAYNDKINSAAVTGTTTKTLTLNQQDGGTVTASWTDINTDAVTSVFGRTGAVVATGGDYTTSQVTEVTNLYYTEGRVSANTDVAANTAARHNAVTLGTANGLSLSTQALSLGLASGSTTGALSSTDWTTFNNKQVAGNYITALTGEVTASGPGSVAATLLNSAVIGKLLTGLNLAGGGTISSSDTILIAFGKTQNQISALVGGVMYEGVWNASTNNPAIVSSVGSKGDYYVVNVAGSTNIDGITDWKVGDWIIFNGTTWDKVDNTDAVSSVNGFTGAVSLTTANISEVTNLYYTDARARAAVSLTVSGSSGASTYNNSTGVFNVPTYTLSGLGGVPTTRSITINGTAFDLSADRTYNVGTVTSVAATAGTGITISGSPITTSGTLTITNSAPDQVVALTASTGISVSGTYPNFTITNTSPSSGGTVTSVAALTIGTTGTDLSSTVANGTTTPVITLQVPTASATNRGALSSADWTTFNNKVGGSGTNNYLPKFTSSSTIGNSLIYESSGVVNVGGQINITTGQSLTLGLQNLQLPTGVASTISAGLSVRTGVANESIIQFGNNLNAYYTGLVDASRAGAMIRLDTRGVAPIPGASSYSVFQIQTRAAGVADPNYTVPVQIAAAPSGSFCIDINGYGYFYNRLRIGNTTTAPTEALSVTGNGVFSSNVTAASLIKSGGTSSQYLMADGSTSTLTNPVTGTGTTNYLPKWTSGSAIGNSQVFDNGTQLAINTASPIGFGTQRFLVVSSVASQVARFTDGANGDLVFDFPTTTVSRITAQYGTGGNLVFASGTGFTEGMRIWGTTGNINIGTTPASDSGYKLDVNGTGRFNGALSGTSATFSGNMGVGGGTTEIGGFTSLTISNSSNGSFLDLNNSGVNNLRFLSLSSVDQRIQAQGNLRFDTGGTKRFEILSTGAATFSSTIQTAAPTGYTAQPWKLGDATSGTLTPNYYIKVEINGQIYSIPALQGTP